MKVIDRRRFLQMGLATTAGVVAASVLPPARRTLAAPSGRWSELMSTQRTLAPAPLADRRLVVLDCAGGNDGISMLPPRQGTARAAYQAARPATALEASTLLPVSAICSATCRAVSRPSPVVAYADMITWPDCSPPRV